MSIEEIRDKISAIDEKLAKLLDERIGLVQKIGKLKKEKGLPIVDEEREREIYEKISRLNLKHIKNLKLVDIFEKIIEISVVAQNKPLRVSFLGPSGTFSEQGARNFFKKHNVKFNPVIKISEVFRTVENDEVDFGVVPIENSTAGSVGETLDLLVESNLTVCGEFIEKIKLCLITKSKINLNEIEELYSHPNPFSQSRKFLEDHFPKAKFITTKSTANAVDIIKNKEKAAAIGSELAAKINNLIILRKGIEDNKNNFTRFFVIGKNRPAPTENDKTSIVFTVKHQPGALINALKPFSDKNINLTKLESRPLKTTTWEYLFFLDFIGNIADENCQEALEILKQNIKMIKILGSYPVAS
ncbi:MAG: prephenate dehydratase [Candidatus Helarchaeota archaeon]